ncbi:MAG TPA: ABC transporter substrate-binding protein, partial [Tepidisphaeraceae bacterium]|nr:ABC transporter substrate-binding protein [Tepidisphaeraceae bacterium]
MGDRVRSTLGRDFVTFHRTRRGILTRLKHIILQIFILLGIWALWPPAEGKVQARLGSAPSTQPANVKYVIKFNPGPLYLPGVVPENSNKPIEGIAKVGKAFEALYPDTRIEFIGVPGDIREWLVTSLSSGQAPDVIQINVEDVWQDIQKGWYLPLDKYFEAPNPFVTKGEPGSEKWWDMFKYPIPTRGTMAPDDHMYCVTLDMIETAIFYNKTMFAKLGLHEPKDWSEFLAIQKVIKERGKEVYGETITPTLIDRQSLADWGVDLTFYQMYNSMRDLLDLDYDPARGEYMHGYLDWDELIFLHKKGFFTPADPRWGEVWRVLKEWRPYLSQDLNPIGTDFVKTFVTQKAAMFWGHSMMVNRLISDPNLGFEWGLFYLPPITKSYSRFANGADQCVIGGSAMQYTVTNHAWSDSPKDPDKSERLKRVMAFLQFLTTPKNCDRVVNEQIALLPNIKGVEPHKELAKFDEILQRRYALTKWFFTFDNQWNEV